MLLLSELRVEGRGQQFTRFRRQKTGRLLAYLAYFPQRPHLRDELVEIFWPEGDVQAGRGNLSVELSALRRQLEPPGVPPGTVLVADRATVRLNPAAITTDVAEFEAALHHADRAMNPAEQAQQLTRAADLYRGELLPGCYDDWVLTHREWLKEAYSRALRQLLGLLEEAGEVERALEYAKQGVEADRLREAAHRDLMHLWGVAGQPEAGLRQYREIERLLREELDAAPGGATRAVARQLASLAEETREAGGDESDVRRDRLVTSPPGGLVAPPPSSLPTGTVTFMLTDIEGSAALWERYPEAMPAALARHDALLAKAIEGHAGTVLKTRGEGDGCFAVFARATDAVAAACALQQALGSEPWPEGVPLRVRVALHTGEAQLRDDDYFGLAVNRAGRLRGIAHGGQILLSLATCEIVGNELPVGGSLRDLGAHRLKDLTRPEPVFQFVHPDLRADFPPLNALDTFRHNLPHQLTSFIGRARELVLLPRLLGDTPLVTLTGAGGCGKTRLALQVAAHQVEKYPDGAWLVELGALSEGTLVGQAVASALGVREEPGRPLLETLVSFLRSKALLLVLDNCEHLLAACRPLVHGLLQGCPSLRILATSRELLGVPGERVYRVSTFSVPAREWEPDLEPLEAYASLQLFVDRARSSQPEFTLSPRSVRAVAEVCRRLEGIPLAIELAAARVKVLSVEQIATRLEDPFRLLTGGSAVGLPHHRTLRATLDWSYGLLSEAERLLLRRLSVFAGGFTLAAAEAVCGGEGIETHEILDLLGQLVDKSLVLVEEAPPSVLGIEEGEGLRYSLLETIRQYGREHLAQTAETASLRRRHLDWYLALAEQADAQRRRRELGWPVRLETEHRNLLAALSWSREDGGAAEAGLRLATSLWVFWRVRGYPSEGREYLESLLSRVEGTPDLRAMALYAAGLLTWFQGDYPRAIALLQECLALSRSIGHPWVIANALVLLGCTAYLGGQYEQAAVLLEECVPIARELEDATLGFAVTHLGMLCLFRGDYDRVPALCEEGLAIARRVGDPIITGLALLALSMYHHYSLSDEERALTFCEECLHLYRELGDKWFLALSLNHAGFIAQKQGDTHRAAAHHAEGLALCRDQGDKMGMAVSLEGLAGVSTAQGELEQSAHLLAAADRLLETLGLPRWPFMQADHRRFVAIARTGLGEEVFEATWAKGAAMPLEETLRVALTETEIPAR